MRILIKNDPYPYLKICIMLNKFFNPTFSNRWKTRKFFHKIYVAYYYIIVNRANSFKDLEHIFDTEMPLSPILNLNYKCWLKLNRLHEFFAPFTLKVNPHLFSHIVMTMGFPFCPNRQYYMTIWSDLACLFRHIITIIILLHFHLIPANKERHPGHSQSHPLNTQNADRRAKKSFINWKSALEQILTTTAS